MGEANVDREMLEQRMEDRWRICREGRNLIGGEKRRCGGRWFGDFDLEIPWDIIVGGGFGRTWSRRFRYWRWCMVIILALRWFKRLP